MNNQRSNVSLIYFIIFLLSVSAVIIVITLPFSEYAYIRLDHIAWLLLFMVSIFKGPLIINRLNKYPSTTPLLLFCIVAMLSTLSIFVIKIANLNLYNSLWYQIALYQGSLIYFITLTVFPINKREIFIKTIIFLGIMLSIIGLLQFLRIIPPYNYNPIEITGDTRATALLSFNSAHLATYLLISIFFSYGYLLQRRNIIKKAVVLVGLLLMILVLIMTKSRSVWVGFFMGNIIIAFYTLTISKGKSILLLIIVSVIMLASIHYMIDIQEVFSNATGYQREGAVYHRLTTYSLFWEYIKQHPLVLITGVGFMNWRYALAKGTIASTGHCVYLTILGDLGIIGLVFFLWFWYRNFKMAQKLAREGDLWGRMFVAIIGAFLAASLTADLLYPVWAMENLFFFIMLVSGVVLSSYNPENLSSPVEKVDS